MGCGHLNSRLQRSVLMARLENAGDASTAPKAKHAGRYRVEHSTRNTTPIPYVYESRLRSMEKRSAVDATSSPSPSTRGHPNSPLGRFCAKSLWRSRLVVHHAQEVADHQNLLRSSITHRDVPHRRNGTQVITAQAGAGEALQT